MSIWGFAGPRLRRWVERDHVRLGGMLRILVDPQGMRASVRRAATPPLLRAMAGCGARGGDILDPRAVEAETAVAGLAPRTPWVESAS